MADFEGLRRGWYRNRSVQVNIVNSLKHREGVFLKKGVVVRCLKINAVTYLEKNMVRYKFFDNQFNLYGSLARFPNLPMFSFAVKDKRQQQDDFNEKYQEYMEGYDFMLDIDSHDGKIASALSTLRKVLPFFAGCPYYVLFSGKKGFHVRIDWEDMPEQFRQMPISGLVGLFKRFSLRFAMINGFDEVDTSIYDDRRISKTPYSVVYPAYTVALPMTDAQIQNFNIVEFSVRYLLGKTQAMFGRGLLKRQGTPEMFLGLVNQYADDL